jgi:peptidyl-dipeptidase Dcp
VTASDNPLLAAPTDAIGLPPFDKILAEHFRPAFDAAMAAQIAAVDAVAASEEAPTFKNTIVALELSGLDLDRVAGVFFHLASADTNDALQAVEREVAPLLARHANTIYLNEPLFRRIESVWNGRTKLGPEEARVVERYHTNFVRAGAALDAAGKKRLAAISERLAEIGTQFSQNVLADESNFKLVLEGDDLAGLPPSLVDAAAEAANERGLPGKHVITLSRSSIEPFLQFSTRRDLREKAFEAWIRRGEFGGATDNRPLISEMIALRAERARLMGYPSYAHFRLADTMAKTPEAVAGLLREVWEPAKRRVAQEAEALQKEIAAEGGNFKVAAWDWRHYAERVRKLQFDFDEAELKRYLQLDKIIEAAFHVAGRLFGLTFDEVKGLPLYHPDIRVWRVTGKGGKAVGVFLGDYFMRASKRSGAWMSALRDQQKLTDDVRPIVVNVMNFAKAPKGQPTLLSFDDARTLFHEFGHALHGLLSDVTYPLIAGTNVARDFVELPSQLYEHWLEEPAVLRAFAVHAETGEAMPEALLKKVLAARRFNQGFATVEYAASALVDLDLHLLPSADDVDVIAFEKAALERIGMPDAMVMRHRTPHFAHIFSGDGYASGYYSYLWSEVLDADAYEAFTEAGDIFHADTAKRLHDHVYSAGYRRDPAEAYLAFRGRMPSTGPLLRKRGLDPKANP